MGASSCVAVRVPTDVAAELEAAKVKYSGSRREHLGLDAALLGRADRAVLPRLELPVARA